MEEYLKEEPKINASKSSSLCHQQSEKYTCFYFDFGHVKNSTAANLEEQGEHLLSKDDIFVGFTQRKYMVLYVNYGRELVAEFPIEDCHVVQAAVKDNFMYLATSKGSVRTYRWPIKEYHCQLQKFPHDQNKAYLTPPHCLQEFQVWMDYSPITYLHPLPSTNQLAVGSKDGYIGLISYRIFKNGN